MKQANNNELDLLLRSLASERDGRGLQSESMLADEMRASSNHLDADELNSYAEGVLPAAARVRYTEHLADCEQCRRLVIGLTQATGAAAPSRSPESQRGSSFWQKMAALFSAPVLRYAIPALALAGIVGIGWLMLRQTRNAEFTAQNHPVETAPASHQLEENEAPAAGSANTARPEIQKSLEPGASTDSIRGNENGQPEKTLAPAPGSDSNVEPAPVLKDQTSASNESGEMQTRELYSLEPKPASPTGNTTSNEANKAGALANNQPAKRDDRDEDRSRGEVFRNTPSDEHGPNRGVAPRSSGAPLSSVRVEERAGARADSEADKKEKAAEAEATTTVSGRRFRHEGNTWFDTAYNSSRAAITVARGSEQYRALVADEPGLGTIAQQLRGVVYVVWKNRTYRIQ